MYGHLLMLQMKSFLYISGFMVVAGKLVLLPKWNLTVNALPAVELLLLL